METVCRFMQERQAFQGEIFLKMVEWILKKKQLWKRNRTGKKLTVVSLFIRVLNSAIELFCIKLQEYIIANAEFLS